MKHEVKSARHRDLVARHLLEIDECLREIASLEELYSELVSASAGSRDLSIRKEEAKFARDRLLKLSLHVKNRIGSLESDI